MLDAFQTGVFNRLRADALVATASVIEEDAADFATALNTAIAEEGLVVIVGQPSLNNVDSKVSPSPQPGMMNLKMEIAVGEDPVLWRSTPDTSQHAKAFADAVVNSLQGFKIAGLLPLVVEEAKFLPDKKRQLYNITIRAQALVPANPN